MWKTAVRGYARALMAIARIGERLAESPFELNDALLEERDRLVEFWQRVVAHGRELPRVDAHMSDDDLTCAARTLHAAFDWSKTPMLKGLLHKLTPTSRLWHEVVVITLTSLEVDHARKHAAQKIDAEFSDDLVCVRCGTVCDDNVSDSGDKCLCDGLFFSRWDAEVITRRGLMLAEGDGSVLYSKLPQHEEGRPHIVGGKFQSDKYPTTPRGKVPLSCADKAAQPLLWRYAQARRAVDAEFAADLEFALRSEGYAPE